MQNLFLWFLSISLLLVVLFGVYPNFDGHVLPKWLNVFYEAASRTAWAVGLAYVIFACTTSHGGKLFSFLFVYYMIYINNKLLLGFVNRFFQLSFWVPLSRLSFSIYLIHTMVLLYFNSMMEHTFHLQDTTIVNINFISFDLYLD